ncbi:hypothetical protein [Actinomycetospora straminea]|uniref:Uncharacterized protein n=1 Tax=Actinomycetospora straminea TaxID=663607 RepID=A0ABP9F997_9PSEU|nr:hypothetical protein [Actinomycetospora straminea]MDD7936345.1 hypothetical protein [Actinomycetospora straminea]
MDTDRFEGWIAGVGTAAGLRAVVGHWPRSPFGAFTDVMVERPDGRRILLAPDEQVRDFVAATYTFDEVRLGPVTHRAGIGEHHVTTTELDLTVQVGGRPPLGWLLRAVPGRLATAPAWITAIDVVARRVLPGVRTVGSAGGGRREYYGARDLHRVAGARMRWEGVDQGALTPVSPPVRFGFGSTPRTPSLVRITTLIRHTADGARIASET